MWTSGAEGVGALSFHSHSHYRPKSSQGWSNKNIGVHKACFLTRSYGHNSSSTFAGFGCNLYPSGEAWILSAYGQDQGTGYCTAACF